LFTRPAIQPFGKINFMTEQERDEAIKETMRIQKEQQITSQKIDCRRTALQMAERSSKNAAGEKNDCLHILADAELFYQWLTKDLK
jgi:hypothetical protein